MASAFFKSAVHHAPISSKSTLTRYLIQPICFYKSHGEQLEEGISIVQPRVGKGQGGDYT